MRSALWPLTYGHYEAIGVYPLAYFVGTLVKTSDRSSNLALLTESSRRLRTPMRRTTHERHAWNRSSWGLFEIARSSGPLSTRWFDPTRGTSTSSTTTTNSLRTMPEFRRLRLR